MNDVSGIPMPTMPRALMAAYARAPLGGALTLDAIVTGAVAAAYLAVAGPLSDLLGLSPGLLRGTGACLLAFACAVLAVATRPQVPRAAVVVIVLANAGWVLASVIAAIAGLGSPTTAGTIWIVLQALVVACLAVLQTTALKRADR